MTQENFFISSSYFVYIFFCVFDGVCIGEGYFYHFLEPDPIENRDTLVKVKLTQQTWVMEKITIKQTNSYTFENRYFFLHLTLFKVLE